MDEYISRQKAIEEMHKWCDPCGSGIEDGGADHDA